MSAVQAACRGIAAPPRASSRYARVRVGRCEMVVPSMAVLKALAPPADGLIKLPRREGALVGLLDLDGSAVPVVSLDRWVDLGQAVCAAAPRIVVLSTGNSLVAIQVDALVGTETIADASIRTVCHEPADEELFEAVVPATSTRPLLCVLEVERLVALASVWCDAAGVRPGEVRRSAPRADTAKKRYALLTIGDRPWAVPATAITQFTRAPRPELNWPGRSVCGIGSWGTRKVPLVDLAADRVGGARPATAMTEASAALAPASTKPWMVVLSAGPQAIGLVVSRCERVFELAAGDILPPGGDPLLAGTAHVDGIGTVCLLDVDRLFATVTEATISQVPAAAPAASTRSASQRDAAPAAADDAGYLVFEADRRYASPVAGLLGVAALSAQAIDELGQGRRTTLEWRGQKVGVVTMPALDGGTSMPAPRVAVIVRHAGASDGRAHGAIAVPSLRDWLPIGAVRKSGMRRHDVGELTMITAPGAKRNVSLVVVDLAQMAYLLD